MNSFTDLMDLRNRALDASDLADHPIHVRAALLGLVQAGLREPANILCIVGDRV
jgi:hypothetical protein